MFHCSKVLRFIDRILNRMPWRHTLVALKMAKDTSCNFRIQFFSICLTARSFSAQNSISRYRGINEACHMSFLFFSSSADDGIEATSLCEYDGASVSTALISNNATVCDCYTPLILRSATRECMPHASLTS